jgi:hypothetical protein
MVTWRVAVVGIVGAVLGGCAPIQLGCDRATCNGCCTADGVCQRGDTPAACGLPGNTCQVCGSGFACSALGCLPSGAGGGSAFPPGSGGGAAFPPGGGGGPPSQFIEPFVSTSYSPAPVSGGTLTLLDDATALVVDADRERLWRVSLTTGVEGYVQFPSGSRPRRAVVGADGRVQVLLRGSGEVAEVDPATLRSGPSWVTPPRTAVCLEPRDLAVDPPDGALLVTCRDGTLVRSSGTSLETRRVAPDLRDLVLEPAGVAFTTFLTAQVLRADGGALAPAMAGAFQPEVAWRTISTEVGLLMLHQAASTGTIALVPAEAGSTGSPYGGGGGFLLADGGGFGCQPTVLSSALTLFPPGGPPRTLAISDQLAVDVAARWTGTVLEVAVAGAGGSGLSLYEIPLATFDQPGTCVLAAFGQLPGQFTGVRFRADGTLVAHDRQGSAVFTWKPEAGFAQFRQYATDLVDSAGSQLFHLVAQRSTAGFGAAPMACASCHPEAIEDGHTWIIDGQPRRTQSLAGGVTARAPFHWVGDLPTLDALIGETFVRRMGAARPPDEFISSLSSWLDSVPALKAVPLPPDVLAAGKAAFTTAGCGGCHLGPQLAGTLNDVGTGGRFKVPTLIGVHARTPLMHSGCAPTLRDRFDGTTCGGTHHGSAALLSPVELDALLAYLGSL